MIRGALLVLVALFYGCAATGPIYQAADSPSSDVALVYVYRPDSHTYGARPALFFVDDQNVADINSNGYSFFYIRPGKYRLRQKWPTWLLEYDRQELNVPLIVNAGETYFYRFETWASDFKPDFGGIGPLPGVSVKLNWRITEVTPSQAAPEISATKLQSAKIQKIPSGL